MRACRLSRSPSADPRQRLFTRSLLAQYQREEITQVARLVEHKLEALEAEVTDALDFLDALNLTQVDLLGFSLGGYIAQHLTLQHPQRVRRLILAGTGPGKGEGTQDLNQTIPDYVP